MVLGMMLVLGAVWLLWRNSNESKVAEEKSEQVMQQLIVEMEQSLQDNTNHLDYKQKEMEEMQIDGEGYVGYLTIPSLKIKLPIKSEWSYSDLQSAPCRYYGATQTEDLVIAAHNYKSHFGNLKNIKMGERILFTNVNGKTYEYEAAEVVMLEATDVELLTNGEFELSLFTCTYDGSSRFVVRCIEIEK